MVSSLFPSLSSLEAIHEKTLPQKTIFLALVTSRTYSINPRPAGVWIVTRPAGGGQRAPLRSPKLLDRFPNFKRHSIALYVNYPYKVKNLTRRSLMTSQVTGPPVRNFDWGGAYIFLEEITCHK